MFFAYLNGMNFCSLWQLYRSPCNLFLVLVTLISFFPLWRASHSFPCMTWLSCVWDHHSRMCSDSWRCVEWLILMREITHSYMRLASINHAHTRTHTHTHKPQQKHRYAHHVCDAPCRVPDSHMNHSCLLFNFPCLTCEWAMSRMWRSNVSQIKESCLPCKLVTVRTTHIYRWKWKYICIMHIAE